jgi:LmbE family N-acetylglucosaminyl deacetylase
MEKQAVNPSPETGENRIPWFRFMILSGLAVLVIAFMMAGMRPFAGKTVCVSILSLYLLYCLFIWFVWYRLHRRTFQELRSRGENVLIVAPHQDDGVAVAGGYAVQTLEMGGRVTVLFMTDGPPRDKTTRRREAVDAWGEIGVGESSLIFLPYSTRFAFLSLEEIEEGIREMERIFREVKPETVFVSLYEGGNYQHDVINYMVRRVVDGFPSPVDVDVYEGAEYNFYFSPRTTPERILSGLCFFLPGIRYAYPPEFTRRDPVYQVNLTRSQLLKKRAMLARFLSQRPEHLILRFGFPDRFQRFHRYDYTRPPFRYIPSLAWLINRLKGIPLFGWLVSRAVKWTRTIHADPKVEMTRIPLPEGYAADRDARHTSVEQVEL